MIPRKLIDTAKVPGGGGELRLMQRGQEFSIMLGQNELMSSRLSGSEEALATLACRQLQAVPDPHMLIGGLGMGFTLRAALKVLGPQARIVVAELVPAVVQWARGPMSALHGDSLSDPRVKIHEGDVADIIAGANASFDAILLDVDNGPEGLTRESNSLLYNVNGLIAAKAALKTGGVLSVWSSFPDPVFSKRLREAGYAVNEVNLRATGKGGGARHVIWMATKPI